MRIELEAKGILKVDTREEENQTLDNKALTHSYWLHGGLVVAISTTVQPRLHISTAGLEPCELFITYN